MKKEVYLKQLKRIVVNQYGFDTDRMITYGGYGLTIGQYLNAVSERDKELVIKRRLLTFQERAAVEGYLTGAIIGIIDRVLMGDESYTHYYNKRLVRVI